MKEEILNQVKELQREPPNQKCGAFIIMSANAWLEKAKHTPRPKALYGSLLHENDITLCVGDSNVGKSIFANQIAETISHTITVLVFDLEMSSKQFEARNSDNYTNHFTFSSNFLRAELDPETADYEAAGFTSLEDYINHSIEQAVITTGARVLIVDNITYLRNETEKAKEALPLMKHLKALQRSHGITILVLAHTPKRDLTRPINQNDVAGSKAIMNFCDSAFAIGQSAIDQRLRYVKQLKCRNAEIVHGTDNVAVYEVTKQANFLAFTFVHTSCEHEHLKQRTEQDKQQERERIIELYNKKYTQRDIAAQVGISLGLVNKIIKSVHVHTENIGTDEPDEQDNNVNGMNAVNIHEQQKRA